MSSDEYAARKILGAVKNLNAMTNFDRQNFEENLKNIEYYALKIIHQTVSSATILTDILEAEFYRAKIAEFLVILESPAFLLAGPEPLIKLIKKHFKEVLEKGPSKNLPKKENSK